jgi:cytochrome P450
MGMNERILRFFGIPGRATVSDLDLYSEDFIQNPYSHYPALLAGADAIFFPKSNLYGIFKSASVRLVLTDQDSFSSKCMKYTDSILLGQDGAEHLRNKQIVSRQLSMLGTNGDTDKELLHSLAETCISNLLANIGNGQSGRKNLVEWIVRPYVMSFMITKFSAEKGMFEDLNILNSNNSIERKITAINEVFSGIEHVRGIVSTCVETNSLNHEMSHCLHELVVQDRYTIEEQVQFLRFLLLAGVDTIASLLSSCIHCLGSLDRSLVENMNSDPELISQFINETLRFRAPAQFTFRDAIRDVQVGDTLIPAASRVAVSLGGAGMDPAVYPNPLTFDIQRSTRNGSFGYGRHAALANDWQIRWQRFS